MIVNSDEWFRTVRPSMGSRHTHALRRRFSNPHSRTYDPATVCGRAAEGWLVVPGKITCPDCMLRVNVEKGRALIRRVVP